AEQLASGREGDADAQVAGEQDAAGPAGRAADTLRVGERAPRPPAGVRVGLHAQRRAINGRPRTRRRTMKAHRRPRWPIANDDVRGPRTSGTRLSLSGLTVRHRA